MTSTCATRALAHHSRLIRLRMGMLAQGLRTFQPPAARFDLFLKKRTSPPTIKKTTPMRSTRVRCGRGGRYGGTVFSGTTSTTRPLTTSTTRPLTTRSNPNVASINPTQHPLRRAWYTHDSSEQLPRGPAVQTSQKIAMRIVSVSSFSGLTTGSFAGSFTADNVKRCEMMERRSQSDF